MESLSKGSLFNQYQTRNKEGVLKLKSTQVKKTGMMVGEHGNGSSLDSYQTISSQGEDAGVSSARVGPHFNAGKILRQSPLLINPSMG